MRYIDVKRIVSGCVQCYAEGRYTVSECLQVIDKIIQRETYGIPSVNDKISQQNKLYMYGLDKLTKAIKAMERRA